MDAYNPKMLAENAASEVSFAQVVRAQFASGAGVCTLSDEMPDAAILLAIRQGLASGKPFTVVPLNGG